MRVSLEETDVKIAVASIGYESIDEVNRCFDPWMGHIDALLLGDGKFPQYPGLDDYSKDGWLEYAHDRYRNKCQVVTYKLAANQVEKRQKYLDIAGEIGVDFLIVMDTDDYIDPAYTDFKAFYKQLVLLSRITPDRIFWMWEWIPPVKDWARQGNYFVPNTWRLGTRIHKDPGTMRYAANNHYTWCSKDTTDEQIYEWQTKRWEADRNLGISVLDRPFMLDNPLLFYTRNVIDGVRIKMDRHLRSKEQVEAGAQWAFLNQHEERFREHCIIQKISGRAPPEGFSSWDEYRQTPHTFNRETGKIILEEKS